MLQRGESVSSRPSPRSKFEKIWLKCELAKLKERIKERFSSRDGFMSFYSSDLGDWPKELKDWDHNQLSTLLEVYQ